ncbi:MAG TPA: hypothetical protein DDY49_07975 [Paenibacillaceae bacterium]|nr:hypothetical protein [Paenibacillaceae bacterium]
MVRIGILGGERMEIVKILVVEDDKEINQLVSRYLQKEGYEIHSAYDGQEALGFINPNTYHLIVLDLMLPVVDGFEVLRRIREKGVTPVLILSAKSEDPDKIIGLGLGADDYVTKPFNMGVFIARVKAMLITFAVPFIFNLIYYSKMNVHSGS